MSSQASETRSLGTLDKERVLHPATSIADHLQKGPRIMAGGSGVRFPSAHSEKAA